MLNEFVYCPRLFFYEWVEGVFAHSGDTVEGALRHDTLGEKPDALPPAGETGDERVHSRSVSLSSDQWNTQRLSRAMGWSGNRCKARSSFQASSRATARRSAKAVRLMRQAIATLEEPAAE